MFGRATIRLVIGPHSSFALFHRILVGFGAHSVKVVEDIPKLSTAEM